MENELGQLRDAIIGRRTVCELPTANHEQEMPMTLKMRLELSTDKVERGQGPKTLDLGEKASLCLVQCRELCCTRKTTRF